MLMMEEGELDGVVWVEGLELCVLQWILRFIILIYKARCASVCVCACIPSYISNVLYLLCKNFPKGVIFAL